MSRKFSRCKLWSFVTVAVLAAVLLPVGLTKTATAETGDIRTVLYEGLPIDEFSRERINLTLKELQEEQDGVKHLV